MQEEKFILNNFECFNEYEDAYLKVTPKSNLYCLFLGNTCRVVWEKIDSINIYNKVCVEYEKSYFDVISNEEILNITEYKSVNDCEESNSKFIVPLSYILKLNEDEEKYLNFNDVKTIDLYKDNSKLKVLKLGKKNVIN